MIGFPLISSKEEKSRRVVRVVKTVFFLITMLISLLLFSAPVLLVIADALLPSAILSASAFPPTRPPPPAAAAASPSSSSPLETLSFHFRNYDFRYSLIDIPLISILRSLIILCVYGFCDGPRLSRGPYLGITTVCSISSLVFVSFKASFVFSASGGPSYNEIALFLCSLVLAVAHIVVAYRTSCRERRKLLVYKIDIEAESTMEGRPRPRPMGNLQMDYFDYLKMKAVPTFGLNDTWEKSYAFNMLFLGVCTVEITTKDFSTKVIK
ncbi:uncharacterized protein LOC112091345 isoform X2 [Morus notabilis]|uniref:uncharacterized protein LOC112091345 isoform X2 n=1 Tax=Morus notabilis TaxID=981085 RepID=UPI000CED3569|nr:uncharacterized protein LOC112091345 isoform X2 [Morus notabilis]